MSEAGEAFPKSLAQSPLFNLLNRESAGSRRDILLAILVSGAANAAILMVINQAPAESASNALDFRLLMIFVVALSLYIVGYGALFKLSSKVFEQTLTAVRLRLMQKVANSELLILHHTGRARIFRAIAQDTSVISESQNILLSATQAAVMVICVGFYVLFVSPAAFITIVAAVTAGAFLYMTRSAELEKLGRESAAEEVNFIGLTEDLIDGLKEVKLNAGRKDDILTEAAGVAADLRSIRLRLSALFNDSAIFAQCLFYVLLAVIVFLLPQFLAGFSTNAPKLVATVLFIIGPLSNVVGAAPAFTRANRAAASLAELEGDLDRAHAEPHEQGRPHPLTLEASIECRGLEFGYPVLAGSDSFHIGPIDLAIDRGAITMLVGGNGSGKTTLLKVIAGLYAPTAGHLVLDGQEIRAEQIASYREMFGAVFSDFHLFRKLYGVAASAQSIDAALAQMSIGDKVRYIDSGFSTRDLSTGQRKRVAMVVTLLEDRPVLIFDEWAAEQDPEFRAHFYDTLLPDLKAAGKTVLVATHDDRFFHIADKIVKLELGEVQSITSGAQA
jgi:putative ATP-binding cassette transporter